MSNNLSDRGPFCVALEDTPQSFATQDILEAVKEFNPQSAVAVSDNTWIVSLKTRTDAENAIRARRISVLSKENEECTVFIKACRPEEIPGVLKQTETDDDVLVNLGGGQAYTMPDSNEKVEFRPGLPNVQINTASDQFTTRTPPRQHNPAMQQQSFGYEPMGQKLVHQFQPSAHVFQSPGSSFLPPGTGHPWGPNPPYLPNQNYPYYYSSPGQQLIPSHGHMPPYAAQYPGYHPSYPANPYQQGGGYYPQYYPASAMDQSKNLTDESASPAESRSPSQSAARSKHVDNADEDVEVKNESVLKELPEVQQQGRQGSSTTRRDDKQKQHAKEEQIMATASRKLKVSDIPHGVSCDALQLLFENEKRSGGGEVKALDFDTDLATAVIEFEDPSVIDRVLEKLPLAVQGQQLKVEIYKEVDESEKVVEEKDECIDLPKTTVEVSGFSQDTSTDSLEMYFENNKRSGGGQISSIDRKDKKALITFESEAVANTVLQKSHKFGGMDLNVKLYVPPPPVPMYIDKLLITGLNEKVTEDCLTNFLEARGGVSPTEILYGEDELKALVTFESPPDFRKLQDACQKKKLEGATLVISQVPISRCVLVTNLATKTSEDTVQLYFENAKRSGGGSVEKVEMNKEARECLIYFEDLKVLDSVLRREHKLDNSEIQLQLFHPCISKTSNAENKGKLQKPESAYNEAVSKGRKKLTGMDVDDKPCKPVPMYKDKLLITGLNEMITEDCLINFLEARGGVSPTETLYAEDDENKALVSFESPPDLGMAVRLNINKICHILFTVDAEGTCTCYWRRKTIDFTQSCSTTFSSLTQDLQKLQDACQKKKLEGAMLVISQVPISRCVLVTNLATKTSEDTVQLYFENAKRSGGGSVEKVEMNKEAGECLIYFEDLKVVDSVLGRKHTLDNSEIQLQLFHPCIGRTTSVENRGKFQNPDSFVFKVNLHLIAFFRQVPNAKVRLEQELSKVHVRMVVPSGNSDTLEVFPTLNAEMEGVRRLAKTWKDTAKQNLEAYMQQLDCLEHQVMPDIWASTVTSLQKVHIPKAEDVIVCADQQQNIIRVVGFKDMVSHVSNSLKLIIGDGEKELELKKQRTSDRRILPQHEIYFLSAVNFPGKLRNICREVECTIQQEDNSIVFEGILLDIKQAQLLMFETIQTIAKSSMPDYSRSKMELLAMKETCDYIRQRLEENGCLGLWESNSNGVIVYDICDPKANEGIQIIKKCLVENTINMTPEQSGVINSDAWNAMLADINRQHQGQTVIRALVHNSTIEITATDQIAGTIIEIVQDFISANALYKKTVTVDLRKMRYLEQWKKPQIDEICKSQQKNMVLIDLGQGVITLQGTQKGLREAEIMLFTLLKQMCCKQKSIEKPGIGKYLCSDKGEELIKHIENVNKCTIDLINEEEVETSLEESQMELQKHLQHPVECLSCKMLGGRTMSVFHGDITDLDIHVLINPSNKKLDHSAGLAKAVVEKGGPVFLNECSQLRRHKLMDGDVVYTKGGNLKCKIVAHGVSPIWQGGSENEEEYLKEVVLKSLEETDKKRFTSIGIPAIGTGIFGWPTSMATAVIVRTVQDYFQDNSNSVIRNVYLCDLDAEHLKAFIDAVKQAFPTGDLTFHEDPSQIATRGSSSLGTSSGGSENISVSDSTSGTSPHRIKVFKGEMAHQQADALVNTTSNKLNLSKGAVSASLLAAGGQQLQDECKNKYPNGIKHGEVAITGAGELRSNCVLHGCLPDWNDDGSTLLILQTFMNNCLSEADQKKLTSIAFPALGTGTLQYPKDVVAREMFNCASDFLTKNADTSLAAVYFVVYPKDLKTFMAFEKEEKEFLKRISSPSKEDGSAKHQKRQRHGGQAYSEVSTTSSKRQSSEFTQVPQVKIIPGDITTCTVDAIVNPTDDTVCLEGGVSRAILRKAGAKLKEKCSTLGNKIKKKGFVVTPGFNLVCGCIIHVNVRSKQYGWKEIILKCLEEAVKRKLQSIAFPALGTGYVGGNPEEIGKALFEAICEIIQAGNNTLQEIQMVVFQPEMVSKIEEGIKSAQESVPKRSTWFEHIKGFLGFGKKASTVQPHVLQDDGMKVFIHICADSENVIEDALDSLDTKFNKELEIDSVIDEVIKRLSEDKVSEIERIGKKHHALIKVEKRLGRVRIEALNADVAKVKSEVLNLIRGIEKMENKEKQAAMLSQLVQWYYIEITADGQDLVEYSKDLNATIEEAYQRKERTLKLQADVSFIIDFDAFEEYPVTDPDDKVKVLRKDKIKVLDSVLRREHKLDNSEIQLQLFHPCISKTSNAENKGKLQKPESAYNEAVSKGRKKLTGMDVDDKPCKPVPMYKDKLLITGLNEMITEDCLINFLEARGGVSPTETLYAEDDENKALVSFESPPDLQKLQDACQKKKLEGAMLVISQVPISRCVLVTNLATKTSEDTVQLYFENAKRSGGGSVEKVEMNKEAGECLIYFEDLKVVDSVLGRKHTLDNSEIQLQLFHPCIGRTTSVENRGKFQNPDSFVFKVNLHLIAFFRQVPNAKVRLEQELSKVHVRMVVPSGNSDTLEVFPTLNAEMEGVRRLAKTWKDTAKQNLEAYMQQLDCLEHQVMPDIWASTVTSLQKVHIPKAEDVIVCADQQQNIIRVVGFKDMVSHVSNSLKLIIGDGEKELELKKQRTSDRRILPQHEIYFLSAVNFPGKLRNICREVECTIQQEDNSIVFEGILLDIKQAQLLMFETIQTIAKSSMPDYSRSKMELLAMKETCDYIRQRLEENGCLGLWESNSNGVIVYDICDPKANEGIQIIKKCLVENTINMTPEQSGVINSDAWNAMLADINRQHQGQTVIRALVHNSTIEITATDQIAGTIIEIVQDFISANALYKKTVTVDLRKMRYLEQWKKPQIDEICKSQQKNMVLIDLGQGVITLQGTQKGLREAEIMLFTLLKQMCCKQKSIEKPGIGKYLCSDKGEELIKHIENVNKCTIDLINEEEVETSLEESQMELQKHLQHPVECLSCKMLGGRTMSVFHGDITDLDIHVLINPSNKKLDHSAGLAKAVVEKGGPVFLNECSQLRRHKLMDGDVVYTKGGNLKCKIVAHGVSPIWQGGSENEEEYLKEVVLKSLEETDKKRFTSIGIPAIGTGIFGWPTSMATAVIVRTVQDYFQDNSNSVIRNVYLCDLDAEHLKAFIDAVKQAFPTGDLTFHEDPSQIATRGSASLGTSSGGSENISVSDSTSGTSPHRIKVLKGEMAHQQADALVNTTSNKLNLSQGAVSASLLAAGGQQLQDECKNKYPSGIKHGEVAITGAGELRSNCVLHGCLPDWNDDGSTLLILQTFMNNCLSEADQKKLTSIAFPALGTGTLQYPKDVVAREMFNCASDFLTKNADTSLAAVYFVVYPKDLETFMAFEKEEKEFLKRISSPSKEDGSAEHQKRQRHGGQAYSEVSTTSSKRQSSEFTQVPQVKIIPGDITTCTVDAIVNPTDDTVCLEGSVSRAILRKAGAKLKEKCSTLGNKIKKKGFVVTPGFNLVCGCIIHVNVRSKQYGWKEIILKCLEEAVKRKLQSIAFPALGTGYVGGNPEEIGKALFEAICEIIQAGNNTLQEIQMVVFQPEMVSKIEEGIKSAQESVPKRSTWFEHIKGFLGFGKKASTVQPHVLQDDGMKVFIHICADSENVIEDALDSLDTKFNKELETDSVIDDLIKRLSEDKVSEIERIGRKHHVQIKVEKRLGRVRIEGLNADVAKVKSEVLNLIRGIEKMENKEKQAAMLSQLVQWYYIEITADGQDLVEYSKDLNATIEEAYQRKERTLKLQADVSIIIDFDAFEEYPETDPDDKVKVLRKDKIKGFLGFGKKASTVQPHVLQDDGMKVFIHICADSENVIEDALDSLDTKFNKELETDSVIDDLIKRLSEDKVSEIERIGRKHHVQIKVEKRLGRVRIEGLNADVAKVKSEVLNLIRGIEKMENKEKQAAMLSQLVQWYYIEITADGQDLVEYSKDLNATIEEAYQRKERTLKLQADVSIIIDFDAFEEYPETDPDDKVKVLRKDKIKDSVSEIPPQWDPMDKDNLKLILLQPTSKEYTDVASLFMATVKKENTSASVPISKIERIQNRTLYAQYQSKKKLIDEMNPGQTNEMDLWHGTAGQAVDSINVHGFNRSFCGKNATMYGDGVYFAKESYYSARDLYSPLDAAGNKKMYLTKVLTGKYALGTKGMRVPPPLVPGRPELHDSVVDNINTPFIFVIFHDTQAYPKYLITFKWN